MSSPVASRYCTRDVVSDPPTTIMIVRDVPSNFPADTFFVREVDVEGTEGWSTRFGKSQLSICFMHSFGKCSGRCNNDPSTCHQIHIKRPVLDALRTTYRNPTRSFFCRTIKAHIGEDLRQALSRIAKKDLTLKYLEYRTQDVEETDGLRAYELAYRAWLDSNAGRPDAFHDTQVFQCCAFASTTRCDAGKSCPNIHASVSSAQVRDHIVSNALRQMAVLASNNGPMGGVPPAFRPQQVPQSFAGFHPSLFPLNNGAPVSFATPTQQNFGFPTMMQQQQQPMYVIVVPQQQYDPATGQMQTMYVPTAVSPSNIVMSGGQPQYVVVQPPAAQPTTSLHMATGSITTPTPDGATSPQSLSVERITATDALEKSREFSFPSTPQGAQLWGEDKPQTANTSPTSTGPKPAGDDIFQAFRTHFAGQ